MMKPGTVVKPHFGEELICADIECSVSFSLAHGRRCLFFARKSCALSLSLSHVMTVSDCDFLFSMGVLSVGRSQSLSL